MKTVSDKLAAALRGLAEHATKADDQAGTLLRFVRDNHLTTAAKFGKAVRDAYQANGWHSGRGRPRADAAQLVAVPRAVRQYVFEIKAALVARMPVQNYRTFYELRKAMADHKARANGRHHAVSRTPELRGVSVANPKRLTGALFHDLAVVYDRLKPDAREHLQASLTRLLKSYCGPKPSAAPHGRPSELYARALPDAVVQQRAANG